MVTVNVGVAVSLAQHVGVTYAPAVVAVSNAGCLYNFTDTISVSEIKKFLKTVLPNVIVVSVSLFHEQYICVYCSLQMYHYFGNVFLRLLITTDLV